MEYTLRYIVLLLLNLATALPKTFGPAEYCVRDSFNATCLEDEAIVMDVARYGRMELGRCVRQNLGYVGCVVDVLPIMDARCSGRRSCSIKVNDDALLDTKPCPLDTTSYLQAGYSCIKVRTDPKHDCTRHRAITLSAVEPGLLASRLSVENGYGSTNCPWIITVPDGQKINITLLNFARLSSPDLPLSGFNPADPSVCYELATVQEEGKTRTILTCGTDDRHKNVYVSKGSKVEIRFADRGVLRTLGYFLLKYEAVGCDDPPAPPGGWVHRDKDTARIRCNHTDLSWYLTCQGGTWSGQSGSCHHGNMWQSTDVFGHKDAFPYGILIIVAIGVALGVFFGGLLLSLAIFYIRRRQRFRDNWNRQEADTTTVPAPPDDRSKDFSEISMDRPVVQWGTYCPPGRTAQFPADPRTQEIPDHDKRVMTEPYGTGSRSQQAKDYGTRSHIYECPQFS